MDFQSFVAGLGFWSWRLQQASWRGVPFAVKEAVVVRGRRTALHEYPDRDTVYVEDLGRGTRSYTFRGFLVGDDVYDQRDAMLDAAEIPGLGTLMHPSLGTIYANLIECSIGERAEAGRMVEIAFRFIEGGAVIFPAAVSSTQNVTKTAANNAGAAVAADASSKVDNLAKS